jgi:hypothetical protein
MAGEWVFSLITIFTFMRFIFICILAVFPVFAQDSAKNQVFADTITVYTHRIIADSVTIEALNKTEEFYNSAFSRILAVITIFLAFGTVGFTYFNSKQAKNIRDELNFEQFIILR